MDFNLLGFVLLAAIALGVGHLLATRPRAPFPPRILLAAIALRIFGSLVRYEVLYRFYGGMGDAAAYYETGLIFARRLWSLDFSVLGTLQWFGSSGWWGTRFLGNVSGLVLSVIGPTMRGEFLIFSLLAFAGLYLLALAFQRSSAPPMARRFALWIFLWPSLWFWPSSVGKEALILLALGLIVFGYAGRHGRLRWGTYLPGLALAFAIRPHVAAMLGLATVAAHWLGSWDRITLRRLLEGAVAVALASLAFTSMTERFGILDADLESLWEFMEVRAGYTQTGGSNIGGVPYGLTGLPLALVNIWMRPFLWDAHNATSLFSALEILVLWGLVLRQRRGLAVSFRHWRRHRLLRFGIPLLIGYTLMIGLTFGNLGIIARQRTPLFPFVFMALAMAPTPVRRRRPAPVPSGARPMPGRGRIHPTPTLRRLE